MKLLWDDINNLSYEGLVSNFFSSSGLAHFHIFLYINHYLAPGGGGGGGVRGIVFTQSVCLCVLSVCLCVGVSVCPVDILVFYFSAIRRDIDLKFMQYTYRVVLDSLKNIDLHRSRSRDGTLLFEGSHITKTEP